jgi:hypothetical protein
MAAPWLPPGHGGHVDLGLGWLRRADLPETGPPAAGSWELPDDTPPLHPLRRRVERVVEGGRAAGTGDTTEIERMRAVLPQAAHLAQRLESTRRAQRDPFGRVAESDEFARAWLAAATYVSAALRAAERDDWLGRS